MITFRVDDINHCFKEVATGDICDTEVVRIRRKNILTKSYKEKLAIVEEFISRVNPYQKPEPLRFNLRGYAKYLKEHNISGKNVNEDIIKRFQY